MKIALLVNLTRPAPRLFRENQWVRIIFGGGTGTCGQIIGSETLTWPALGISVVRYHVSNHLGWVNDWQLEACDPDTFMSRVKALFR